MILTLLLPIGLAGGNYAYDLVIDPIAVAYDEDARRQAHAEQDETLLCLRMSWIGNDPGILIEKGTARFLEGDAVLLGTAVEMCVKGQIDSISKLLGSVPLPSVAGLQMTNLSVGSNDGYVMVKGQFQ